MVIARLRYELCTERQTEEDEWIFPWGGDNSDEEEEGDENARREGRQNRGRWRRGNRRKRFANSAEGDGEANEERDGAYDRWRKRAPYLGPTVQDPTYEEPLEARQYVPPAYTQNTRF